jgi:hypothetical protein
MKKTLSLIFIFFSTLLSAQEVSCAFEQRNDSATIKQVNALIEYAKQSKSESDEIFKIPVVIHNIYKTVNGSKTGDISKEQMASQVDFLNEIYNAQYKSIASGPNHGIEFYLANTLPDGTPTDGLFQYDIDSLDLSETNKALYKNCGVNASGGCGMNDALLKGAVALPNQSYYNILLVTEMDNNDGGGGVQGFAYFPTTSVVDGITQIYNTWGLRDEGYYPDCTSFCSNLKSYTDKGATGVHEAAHAFALFHTFQSTSSCIETNCDLENDRCCDTPPTILNSSCSSPACNGTQQVENYMDYTSQTCKDLLTPDQGERMRLTIANSRTNLINNFETVHEWKPTTIDVDFELPATLCSTTQDYQFTVTNTGENTLERLSIVYGSNYTSADTLDIVLCLLPNQYKTIHLPPLNEAGATVGMDILKVNTLPYEMEPIIRSSEVGNIEIVVEFVSDILGSQNNWTLERNGAVVASRASYPNFQDETTHLDTICVKGGCLTFTFNDVVGNGVCCFNGEGSLNLYVNGELYATLPETFTDVWSVSNCEAAEIEGYYNFMGEELPSEPTEGWYIIRYTNNTYTKHLKR